MRSVSELQLFQNARNDRVDVPMVVEESDIDWRTTTIA